MAPFTKYSENKNQTMIEIKGRTNLSEVRLQDGDGETEEEE